MKEKYIYTKVTGGLGNQMFQYACGYALAKRLHSKMFLDITFYEGQNLRAYELEDIFPLSFLSTTKNHINKNFFGLNTPILRRFVRRANSYLPLAWRRIYEEPYYGYHQDIFGLRAPALLVGYWQSPKYFSDLRSEILREFKPKNKLDARFDATLAKIKSTHSVSLHIRRGDYVSNQSANEAHGLCSLEYYNSALALIRQNSQNALDIFIFSDDIEWCRQNLKFDCPLHFIDNPPDKSTETDLFLMSQCEHNIIANSSYSWWGAWLNENPRKVVIAPSKWFQDPKLSNPDIYPMDWILI